MMTCMENETKKMLLSKKNEEEEEDGSEEEEDGSEEEEEEDESEEEEEEDGSEEEEDGSEEEEGSQGEEEDGSEEEKDDGDDKEEDGISQASDKTDKLINLPVPPKEKKPADVLNLNNEVVKMRKEVKKIRALIIRKLTRQIGALKKKKGKDAEVERNQRRAARLLEEIHAMKILTPDLVTKTALQKDLNFDEVCKNPKSTISDRAIARIATHPQFNKKINDIKAAVKAFKEERLKGGKQGRKENVQNQAVRVNPQSPDKKEGVRVEKKEEESTEEQKESTDNEEGDGILKVPKAATMAKPERENVNDADTANVQKKDMPQFLSVKSVSVKSSQVKDAVKDKEKKPAAPQKRIDEDESDLELSEDDEKEYFDDSTEERFHKQSSQSEESDEDDFFVGKVSKFKKNKKKDQKSIAGEDKKQDIKKDLTDKVQSELDELEARLKSKATAMQSVFCSSLSGTKQSRGGGAGRGRGGEKFRGQGKMRGGPNRDFIRQSKYQKPEKGEHSNTEVSCPEPEVKGFAFVGRGSGRGRGRGRGDAMKHSQRDRGVFSHQAPQQALHPSWEASKKRKEQQGQILAFQGKKIKFDDDD